MSHKLTLYLTGFALVVGGATLALSTSHGGTATAQKAPPPPAVTVAPVEQRELIEWDEFTGRVEPVEMVEVRPRVSGHIQEVRFESGQLVRKGEVLFIIDPRWHQAEFDRREADYQQAQVRLENAEREAGRTAQLLANHAISTEESEARQARSQEAKAALLSARAARDSAKLDLDYTEIRSPINGRISRALITVGNYVSGVAGASTVLTTIVSVDPIYVFADVDENSLLKFNALAQAQKLVGMSESKVPVELQLSDEDGFPHHGMIESFDNRLDPNTGSILLRAVFANPDGRLVPGLFARIRVPLSERYAALLVSERAISTDQTQKFVLTLTPSNTVQYCAVKLGPEIDGKRIIRSGLKPGDQVIVNGLQRIRPGMPVTPEIQTVGNARLKSLTGENMNFSHFFIRRPIFAGVLSALIFILGLISMFRLPISEYPEVVPPTIVVQATYPGANPKTISETVAAPLEQAINGVENSLYMFSQSTGDGVMALTVTFKLGTDVDKAQVQVQNRVAQALPKLPEEVRQLGVTTTKQSPDLTMVVHLVSPNGRYDEIYLRNYATLQVKDVLARIPGAGSVQVFGSGDYAMRVWLDPNKVAAKGLTASDVVSAIREQNIQVAAGAVGQQPVSKPVALELQINAKGRLLDEEEFGQIILKTGERGEKIQLKDVARLELGASGYSLRSLLNNKTAVAIPIFQLPGANALELSKEVRHTMAQLKRSFPEGIDYSVVYDPTVFVRHSIEAVVHTLLEAIALVVLVVLLFLQTWRASIIPLAAVPVSLVGTFAIMLALGFSVNALSLFGLVLAIGIVVDDAIVVVENVERNIALGLSPMEATKRAMSEVTGPIIATALVLCAVFVPTAFISGLTGQFYKQFAITIAISTVISAFNSLTLSPALSALLLKGHHAPKDLPTRLMDRLAGWLFRPFNRLFALAGDRYSAGVGAVIRKGAIALAVYAGLVLLTGWSFDKVPTGFVPTQDKQYLVAFAQLPDAASLDRSEAVIRKMSDIGLKQPGVQDAVAFPGLSISGFSVAPNAGIVFFGLKPFEERKAANLRGPAIAAALNAQFASIQEAFILTVPPPPVNGLGTIGGFKLLVEDRADLGYDALYQNTQALIGKGYQTPGLGGLFSTFTVNVPQLDAEIDRVKAKTQGVPLQNLFETMQIYLGSLYVNDFNRFGRTFQVIAQADAPFREHAEAIARLKTRNAKGQMVPLGTLVKVKETHGPDRAMRYNGYPAAEINGGPAAGFSSGQAEAVMAKLAGEDLPKGMTFEWTDLTYQRILAGNTAVYVYPLCLLLVFLVLAAQSESLRLPLAIILIVPMCLLFAITGVWLKGSDNNIFTQIGLIVLVGLACKNAILIVEFAKHKQDLGLTPAEAAIEACRLRLRPILMTSIAFIAGVFPLVAARGAGAEMRQAMGVAVFAGMIGVTIFGLFLTPVFYVTLMRLGWKKHPAPAPESKGPSLGAAGAAAGAAALLLLLTVTPAKGGLFTVGPDYHRPTNDVPDTYKAAELGSWKQGRPLDNVPKGNWWGVFGDSSLDQLESQAQRANQELKVAFARVDQARATARVARADLLPNLNADPSLVRQRFSPNQEPSFGSLTANTFSTPLDLSYELDLWGRVRRGFESARAEAAASVAALHTILLTLQADVAQDYFLLRSLDAEIASVTGTVELRKQQVQLVRSRFEGGIGNELDIARAETELATTEADAASLARRRAELENALAILVGVNPASFKLPALEQANTNWNPEPPTVPAGLPADLLERRPDVAEAERQLAAANARIGVAKAAFFPVVRLTASGGYVSGDVESLFNWDSRVWSIGPSVSLPIFAGGRNRANFRRSQAAFQEAVAKYRQQILVAFGDIEDSLAGIHHLANQATAQARALGSARRAADLATQRYRSGLVSYLEVVDASREALQTERGTAQLAGQRLVTAVQLIKALGGGWQESHLLTYETRR